MPADPTAPRRLAETDTDAVVDLHHEVERSFGLTPRTTTAELRDRWALTDLERCSWAFEEDGRLVALGWATKWGDRAAIDGLVAPAARSRGFGTRLCELGESAARELGLETVLQHACQPDAAARALFESRGYAEVRRFFEMVVELDLPPSPPPWPAGIVVQPFRAEHARAFYDAGIEAFADEWGFSAVPFDEWLESRVRRADTSLYAAAWDGDEIAGIIRCELRPPSGGFVAMLGVRPRWRRRGLGRALLLHAFGAFYERGERRVSLGVDAENPTGATGLYEGAGMTVEGVAVAYEKRLA